MNTFLIYLPFIISFLIGYFLICLILGKTEKGPCAVHLFLASGLGMGVSVSLVFFSYVFFNELKPSFALQSNLGALGLVFVLYMWNIRKDHKNFFSMQEILYQTVIPISFVIILAIPLWNHSHFYAYGGWDAWSTWNLKAKFLFLADQKWTNIFNPILWRSSPHYPLFLPLAIVWGWVCVKEPSFDVPVFTSFIFTFLTAGLLFVGLKKLTKTLFSALAAVVLLTFPLYLKLSLSQYCDIVLSFYLLASLFCLVTSKKENSRHYALLAGIFCGFLGFTKTEGFVAALIIILLAVPFLLWKNQSAQKRKSLIFFLIGAAISLTPALIFYIFYSPNNITVINGLVSVAHPSTFHRLKLVLSFYLMEIVNPKWHGAWIVLLISLLLGKTKGFRPQIIIVPVFFLFYVGITTFYYFINTYFEIQWWLQVTLHRIIYATLPVVLFWVFYALWQESNADSNET